MNRNPRGMILCAVFFWATVAVHASAQKPDAASAGTLGGETEPKAHSPFKEPFKEPNKTLTEADFDAAFFPKSNPNASPAAMKQSQAKTSAADEPKTDSKRTNPSILLLTHDGQWQGNGGDMFVELFKDRSAIITYDGCFLIEKIRGTYKISNDGTMTIIADGAWPASRWRIDSGQLVVEAPPKDVVFAAARKFGIAEEFLTDQEYEYSYCEWPLREYHHKAESSKKRKTKKSDDESVCSTRPGC